ncbi:GNAT family N-acetyltransferase [Vibrio parahaemolyticus]|nr:GNAT family N-acetyltransferase [Vibrio parahaemolyticus]EGQ8282433.1 GNAT family N-acetyltransferase [Vibrio parahaemolyticus]EGQ8720411.1 GNAT family N-acetyltransferase [Vibrio parahaemolyticus]EGQ8813775.1 GNAT family N-acetyltransferase [Vibrio parahaemolyticus]EGQ8835889.1 GNAT family N-acetyltransferase [Vibrio parahaemolyticus]
MYLREATPDELEVIYPMGFDVWGDGLSFEDYLSGCRNSEKYQVGTWFVLIENDQILSSLVVYSDMFGLRDNCFGLGSIATSPSLRGKGYASHLIGLVKAELFSNYNCKAVYLHSDIGHEFYSKLGFVCIENSDCMFSSIAPSELDGSIPAYF